MRLQNLRPRFSLGLLLLAVVSVGLAMGLRQGLYVPLTKRAELRRSLEEAGLTVRTEAPPPSWRGLLFSANDLLEVVEIQANEGRLPDTKLRQLWRFPRLRSVSLRGCDVADEDVADLARIDRLETLDLANTRVGDEGLARLRGRRLVDLDLMGTRVTGLSLPTVATMTGLRRLILPIGLDTDDLVAMEPLGNLSILAMERDLFASTPGLTYGRLPESLHARPWIFVGQASNPLDFGTGDRWGASDVPPLRDWSETPPIGPPRYEVTVKDDETPDWDALRKAPLIHSLTIERPLTEAGLRDLETLSEIERLVVRVDQITKPALEALLQRPGLRSLTLTIDRLDNAEELFAVLATASQPYSVTIQSSVLFEELPDLPTLARASSIPELNWLDPDTNFQLNLRSNNAVRLAAPVPGGPPVHRVRQIARFDQPPRMPKTPPVWPDGEYQVQVVTPLPEEQTETLLAWLSHPRVSDVIVSTDQPIDPRIWSRLMSEDHLSRISVIGPLEEAQAIELLQRPGRRVVVIASDRLRPESLSSLAEATRADMTLIASPRFSRADCRPYSEDMLRFHEAHNSFPGQPRADPMLFAATNLFDRSMMMGGMPSETEPVAINFAPSIEPQLPWLPLAASALPTTTAITTLAFAEEGVLERLEAFSALTRLRIEERHYGEDLPLPRDADLLPGLDAVPQLGQLETLVYLRSIFPSAEATFDRPPTDLPWLDRASSLRELGLGRVAITASALKMITDLPEIESLHLGPIGGPSEPLHQPLFRRDRSWQVISAPRLDISAEDLDELTNVPTLKTIAFDGRRIDASSVPTLETLLDRGVSITLLRANLDAATVKRLQERGAASGGEFHVTPVRLLQTWQIFQNRF